MSSEKALVRCEKRTSVTLVTCHPECSYHAHRCSAPLGTAFGFGCARACARVRSAVGVAIFPLPDTLSLSVIVQTGHVNIIGLTLGRSHQSVGCARPPFVTSDKNNASQPKEQGSGFSWFRILWNAESVLDGERARSQVRVLWVLLDSSASYDTIG